MAILIGPFKAIELASLLFGIAAFAFVYKAYKTRANDPVSKKFWTYFLLIALFIMLGRLFDVLDDLAFWPYFNLLQHLSSIPTAVVFLILGKNTLKGDLNG